MRYLFDTDICIYIKRNRPSGVRARFDQTEIGAAGMSTITYGELIFGAVRSQRSEEAAATLRALVRLVPVLALPSTAADHYGHHRARLTRLGTPIGSNDLWIAAHALASDLTLVTNNEREFRRVEGLRVENWAAEP